MAALGWFAFSNFIPAVLAAGGITLGWLLRGVIVRGLEYYYVAVPVGLAVYSMVLFLGQRLGMDRETQLTVITLTTVIVFNLRFWSLSDPEVFNLVE